MTGSGRHFDDRVEQRLRASGTKACQPKLVGAGTDESLWLASGSEKRSTCVDLN